MNNCSKALLASFFWLICAGAAALSSDRDQPINIEADWAEADDIRRVTVYKGRVVVVQGSIRITGDVVTMYYDQKRELTKLVATGRPARFKQKADQGELQRADAKRLEYLVGSDTMVLVGTANLAQGKSKVSADRIMYDTQNSQIKAESKKEERSRGRVRIVIDSNQQ
ncbi:MAG: lipopolysaccharide transport periplasmic protein LptA [Gammaproteobacteria bacterium]|nr:lipopolysaccharide transport periplasmic protein LptA [Gammaproteobacteria bacterium]